MIPHQRSYSHLILTRAEIGPLLGTEPECLFNFQTLLCGVWYIRGRGCPLYPSIYVDIKDKFGELVLFLHLCEGSENWTYVTRLAQKMPLPTDPSHQSELWNTFRVMHRHQTHCLEGSAHQTVMSSSVQRLRTGLNGTGNVQEYKISASELRMGGYQCQTG